MGLEVLMEDSFFDMEGLNPEWQINVQIGVPQHDADVREALF